jgi:hypothetical protein
MNSPVKSAAEKLWRLSGMFGHNFRVHGRGAVHQGDHVCVLYATEEERFRIAAEYTAEGLGRGERCVYISQSPNTVPGFHQHLRQAGIIADEWVERSALLHLTHVDTYLVDSAFDVDRMLRVLDEAVDAALRDGFVGLRLCGDMCWLLEEAAGSEQVVEYEALLNQFFPHVRASALCQYDVARLKADVIDHGLATHPTVMIEGRVKPNPFYKRFQEAVTRAPEPHNVDAKLGELRRL